MSNTVIDTSIRVAAGVLKLVYSQFNVRPVFREDIDRVEEILENERPWDPETISKFPIPGTPEWKEVHKK